MPSAKRASLGLPWFMGLAAALAASCLLAIQIAFSPPWVKAPPQPIATFPTLHGPTPSELFAALTGRERQATIDELKAMRQLLDAGPDAAALPTIKAHLATLQEAEEHKQQQETTPALALAGVVGRIDGAIEAIDQVASRVNANPPPPAITPISLGVAGLGLFAALLGLLAGAARPGGAPPIEHGGAPPIEHGGGPPIEHGGAPPIEHGGAARDERFDINPHDGAVAVGPDLTATLRDLLDEAWAELARQREAASANAHEQALLGARLTGAVLDFEGRLAADADLAGLAQAAVSNPNTAHDPAHSEAAIARLDAICDQLGEAVAALPSVTAVLAEAAEALRTDVGNTVNVDHDADRLAEQTARLGDATSRLEDLLNAAPASVVEQPASMADLTRLDAIASRLEQCLAGPSDPGSNIIAAIRNEATTLAHARNAANASQAGLLSRLDALAANLEAAIAASPEVLAEARAALESGVQSLREEAERLAIQARETLASRLDQAVADGIEAVAVGPLARMSALAEQAIGAQAKALDDHPRALGDAIIGDQTPGHETPGHETPGHEPAGHEAAFGVAAGRLLAAAESQAERLELLVRDIVTIAGSIPSVGQGLAETAVSISLAARQQSDIANRMGDQLAEVIGQLDATNSARRVAGHGTPVRNLPGDLQGTIAGGLLHAMLPTLDDAASDAETALPPFLPATLRHIAGVEQETACLATQAEALARAKMALPQLWVDGTPALLSCIDAAIHRLRSVSTALAMAGDGSLAKRVA